MVTTNGVDEFVEHVDHEDDVDELVTRLTADVRNAAKLLSQQEARYLVDQYYTVQNYRKATANQIRALSKGAEPTDTILYFNHMHRKLEAQLKKVLDVYTDNHEIGQYLKSITGIGPVIAAGLLAHIDIRKAPYAGNIQSFAGFNPTMVWEKGKKRPFNAKLKVICFHAGESFIKRQNSDKDHYGKYYVKRKEWEAEQNANYAFADQAREKLEKFKIGKDKEAYKWYSQGLLPPAHVHARARRWVIKLWLSHVHAVWYAWHFNDLPPVLDQWACLQNLVPHAMGIARG
jgi:hypothetical protein